MARSSKPVALLNSHLTKEEIRVREEAEARYKGADELVYSVPKALKTKKEKEMYLFIVEQLKSSNILNNLDIELIVQTVNAVIGMEKANKHIKKYGQVILKNDGTFAKNPSVNIYKDYQAIYTSNSIRLGLSPSDRAKLAAIDIQKKEQDEDPLLKILGESKE